MKHQRRPAAFVMMIFLAASAAAAQWPRSARNGYLGGQVLGLDGKAAKGARVFMQASYGSNPHAAWADASGYFRFSVRPGLYELRAQARGRWSDWEHNVLVRPGRETRVTLRLLLDKPPTAKKTPAMVELHGHVREWTLPIEDSLPHDPAVDPQGNVWLTLQRANRVARLNPETGEWKLFTPPTEDSGPHGLTADADGNIWFTENSAGKIGRVDARTGQVTEYKAPAAEDPHTPVFGPDGALWFTAQRSNLVMRLDTKTWAMREFRVPTPNARPYGIVVGPDGALWFCEFGTNKLGRIDVETGAITEYEAPAIDARPRRLAVAGYAIYFTDFRGGRLGQLNLTHKSFQDWPSPSGPASQPYGIAADAEGNVWYCEFGANQLIRFSPKTQAFERFPLPSAKSEVRHMVRDAKGRIWMALSGANKVAVIE